MIRHLPVSAPAGDISDGLLNLGFDVIRFKQMSDTRRSPAQGASTVNILLFLTTLHRSKFHEIFKVTSFCHIAIKVETYKVQTDLTQHYTANNSNMSGRTASNLPVVYSVGAVTCTRNTRKGAIQHQYRHAATSSWWTDRNLIPQTIEAAGTPRKGCERETHRELLRLQQEKCSLPITPP
jgi:hypothetical protein